MSTTEEIQAVPEIEDVPPTPTRAEPFLASILPTSPLYGAITFEDAVQIVAEARGMNEAAAVVFLKAELEEGALTLYGKGGTPLKADEFRKSLENV